MVLITEPKHYQSTDPVTHRLKEAGTEVFNYYLDGQSFVMGGVYRTEDAELAYQYLPDEHSLLLIYFASIAERRGLLNPFREISRMTDLCARLGLKEISGYVSAMYVRDGGLSQERMIKFYQRKFKAVLYSRMPFTQPHERSKRLASGVKQGPMTKKGDYFMFLDLDQYREREGIQL